MSRAVPVGTDRAHEHAAQAYAANEERVALDRLDKVVGGAQGLG